MCKSRYLSLSVFVLSACLSLWLATASASWPGSSTDYATYSHPLGLQFQHPQSWTVFESALGLQVNPPDAGSSYYGPTEAYFFTIMGADPTVSSLADPQAAQLLNGLVAQILPFLQPKGESRAVGESGRVFSYNGTSPEGIEADCHVFGQLTGGYFISLIALGEVQAVSQRETEIVNIFKSLKFGAPEADPQHASTWYSNSYSSSGSYGDRVNTSTQHTMTLLPDGRLSTSAQTSVHGWSQGESGGPDRTSITGLTDASTEEGRWAISGSDLYLLWKDVGVVKWSIYIQGEPGRREMFLTPAAGGEGVLWTEYPDF
ncbi:MAG: hypothetical protein ABIF77_05925 [bacterium]